MSFEYIKIRIEEVLKSYSDIEILKYESAEEHNGVFLVRYKEYADTDAFTFEICFDCETIDLSDCNGYGFDSIAATAECKAIKEMFDKTFSSESVEYNTKEYYKCF